MSNYRIRRVVESKIIEHRRRWHLYALTLECGHVVRRSAYHDPGIWYGQHIWIRAKCTDCARQPQQGVCDE